MLDFAWPLAAIALVLPWLVSRFMPAASPFAAPLRVPFLREARGIGHFDRTFGARAVGEQDQHALVALHRAQPRHAERNRVAERRSFAGEADERLVDHLGQCPHVERWRRLQVRIGAEYDQADSIAGAPGDEPARVASHRIEADVGAGDDAAHASRKVEGEEHGAPAG